MHDRLTNGMWLPKYSLLGTKKMLQISKQAVLKFKNITYIVFALLFNLKVNTVSIIFNNFKLKQLPRWNTRNKGDIYNYRSQVPFDQSVVDTFLTIYLFYCSGDQVFKGVDKTVLKAAYSGIVALALEAAKHDTDANGLRFVN